MKKKENEYHDVSSSNRSISNSSLKTWHHQFLKIDFRIINNEKMSQKSVLVLRYITLELCITIHYTEIIIPLNQVRKFQLASNRNIYLELKKDFVRYASKKKKNNLINVFYLLICHLIKNQFYFYYYFFIFLLFLVLQ